MIFHGPNFWKWFVLPGAVYVVERVRRFMWLRSERGKTYISSGLLLPSRVTHLVIKRPQHLVFRPGDYVFVNIPVIARYEWHPFTISSAPEQEGKPFYFLFDFQFYFIYFLSSLAFLILFSFWPCLKGSHSQSPCNATLKSCLLTTFFMRDRENFLPRVN